MLEQERAKSQPSTKLKAIQHTENNQKEKLNISILTNFSKLEIKTLLETWFWILLNCPLLIFCHFKVSYFLLPCFLIYLSENCVVVQTVLHIAVAPPGRELQIQRWHNQTQIGLWNKRRKKITWGFKDFYTCVWKQSFSWIQGMQPLRWHFISQTIQVWHSPKHLNMASTMQTDHEWENTWKAKTHPKNLSNSPVPPRTHF